MQTNMQIFAFLFLMLGPILGIVQVALGLMIMYRQTLILIEMKV